MNPLGGVAAGLVLALFDLNLRFGATEVDVLPDVIGWLLVVIALAPLRRRHDLVGLGQGVAAVLLLASALAAVAPDFEREWAGLVESVLHGAFGVLLLTALIALARRDDIASARGARDLRVAVVLVALATPLAWAGPEVTVGLAVVSVVVWAWFVVFLWTRRDRAWVAAPQPVAV